MKIIDRYIAHTVIFSTLMVSAVVASLLLFISLVNEVTGVQATSSAMLRAFLLALLSMPTQFYALFPIAAFLGVLIGLGRLAATSQLIVIRASGISIVQITWSVMKAAIAMVVIVTILGEVFVPKLQYIYRQAEADKGLSLREVPSLPTPQSIWIRQNNVFTHIDGFDNVDTMHGVTRYFFSENDKMKRVAYADKGHFENKRWELQNLQESIFEEASVDVTTEKTSDLTLHLRPKMEAFMEISPDQQSLSSLYKTMAYRRSFGLTVSRLSFDFWERILQPFTSLLLMVLAVPFVFGSLRDTSASSRVMLGVMLGVVFYTVSRLFGPITIVYQFPPFLAALMPMLAFLAVALVLLLRT
ncbi:MAG: LPS export ABC transporter permease LptG [Coxiellaceae bacterium]|nr:LPS export ABC transporter permease LptG [Coxiellaceae bacterium]